jgi:hypothetical protein
MALATPIQPTGIGLQAALNVFKVTFSEELAAPPQLHAWDDEDADTHTHVIFAGTENNGNKPMVAGIGLTEAPPAADWFPSSKVIGAEVDVASLLEGDEGFCEICEELSEYADEEMFFNVAYKIPSDLNTSDTVNHIISIEYSFTGPVPKMLLYVNTGTEAVPVWTKLYPEPATGDESSAEESSYSMEGSTVIRLCSGGEGYNGTGRYKLVIPNSGEEEPDEYWLVNYED